MDLNYCFVYHINFEIARPLILILNYVPADWTGFFFLVHCYYFRMTESVYALCKWHSDKIAPWEKGTMTKRQWFYNII